MFVSVAKRDLVPQSQIINTSGNFLMLWAWQNRDIKERKGKRKKFAQCKAQAFTYHLTCIIRVSVMQLKHQVNTSVGAPAEHQQRILIYVELHTKCTCTGCGIGWQ